MMQPAFGLQTIGKMAGMLMSAVSQDVQRHNSLLQRARHDAITQTNQSNRRRARSRRIGKRSGNAAEKFAMDVAIAQEERRLKAVREEERKKKELQQQAAWIAGSEEMLF